MTLTTDLRLSIRVRETGDWDEQVRLVTGTSS